MLLLGWWVSRVFREAMELVQKLTVCCCELLALLAGAHAWFGHGGKRL